LWQNCGKKAASTGERRARRRQTIRPWVLLFAAGSQRAAALHRATMSSMAGTRLTVEVYSDPA